MNICILIPAYNEVEAIGSLLSALNTKGFDVIVIDDGSTDGTGDAAAHLGAQVIRNTKNHGKGYSLQRGFDYIVSRSYDAVVVLDADGQHSPNDLKGFLDLYESDRPDIICGNRMRAPEGMPGLRFVTNKTMSKVISWVCGQKVLDTQCGYRLIRVDVLRRIQLSTTGFEIESEVLIKASKKGYRIASVDIQTIYSKEKSHISPLFDTLRFFGYIIRELFTL